MKHLRFAFVLAQCVGAFGTGIAAAAWKGGAAGELPRMSALGAAHPIRALHFTSADTGYAVGDSGTVLKTVDGGLGWTLQSIGTTQNLTRMHWVNSRIAWITGGPLLPGYRSDPPVLLRTTDAGQTWQARQIGDTTASIVTASFKNADTGVLVLRRMATATISLQVWRTENGGATWDSLFDRTPAGYSTSDFSNAYARVQGDTLLVAHHHTAGMTAHHLVYCGASESLDGGASWAAAPCERTSGAARVPTSAHFSVGDSDWVGEGDRVLRSTNRGQTWTASNALPGLNASASLNSIFFRGNTGYAAGPGGYLAISRTAGATWGRHFTGTHQSLSNLQIVSPDVAYALAGTDSLLRMAPSFPVIGLRLLPGSRAPGIRLRNAVLDYSLSTAASVRIAVRDARGRERLRLKDAVDAPGDHSLPLATGKLPSGTYVLEFHAGPLREVLPFTVP